MKTILSFFLVIISITASAQVQDTIHWCDCYELKWEDFNGNPDSTIRYKARTNYSLTYNYSLTDTSFRFNISCYFNRRSSWKKTVRDSLLLHHEQGHFDIGELFARKLRQKFSLYKPNSKTIDKDLKTIFEKVEVERLALDTRYDEETNFSVNKIQQLLWNEKIMSFLSKEK